MTAKRAWSIATGLLNHILAWVLPLVYIALQYSFFLETAAGRLAFFGIVGLVIFFRFMMHRLNAAIEDGYGMEKEIARETKFLIPLLLVLAFISIVHTNIAGLYDVIIFTVAMNIPASIFRVISYRLSNRYENDVAPKKILDKMNQQQ